MGDVPPYGEDAVARRDDLYTLPDGLPVPIDDGRCDHLTGMELPAMALASTGGGTVDLSTVRGTVVVYCYPRTGHPDRHSVKGWNAIPGARGCTPQTCAFRDHHRDLADLGARVYGLSTQTTEYQREMVRRLRVPFAVLSDAGLAFARALALPTFTVDSITLIKRLTLIATAGTIDKVFYPVFPPDRNAEEVIGWLSEDRRA